MNSMVQTQLLKEILENNTLYEVEDIDGKLEYKLDSNDEKISICEMTAIDFLEQTINKDRFAIFLSGTSPKSDTFNEEKIGMEFHQGKTHYGDMYLQESLVFTTSPTTVSIEKDILISMRAPAGAVNINMRENDICLGRGLGAIRVNEECYYKYIYHALNASDLSGRMGMGYTSITKPEIEQLVINIPKEKTFNNNLYSSYELQQSIAKNIEEKLSMLEYKINILKMMNIINTLNFEYLLKSIFENKSDDVVEINNERILIKDIIFTKTMTLDDISLKMNSGATPPRDVIENWDLMNSGEYPWLDIDSKEFLSFEINNYRESITKEGIKSCSTWLVPKNSVMVTIAGSLGFVAKNKFSTYTNQNILSIVLKDEYLTDYIVYYLEYLYSNTVRNKIKNYSNLSKKTESSRKVYIPNPINKITSTEIQSALVEYIDKVIKENESKKYLLNSTITLLEVTKEKLWKF